MCYVYFIGFSAWLMIPIRSNANTVINENSPSDARALLAYYNLEQYPETKLFMDQCFQMPMLDKMKTNLIKMINQNTKEMI